MLPLEIIELILEYTNIPTIRKVMDLDPFLDKYLLSLYEERINDYKFSHSNNIIIKKDTGTYFIDGEEHEDERKVEDLSDEMVLYQNGVLMGEGRELLTDVKMISNLEPSLAATTQDEVYVVRSYIQPQLLVKIKYPIKKLVRSDKGHDAIVCINGKLWVRIVGDIAEADYKGYVKTNMKIMDATIVDEDVYWIDAEGRFWLEGEEMIPTPYPLTAILGNESRVVCLDTQGDVYKYDTLSRSLIKTGLMNVHLMSDIYYRHNLSVIRNDGLVQEIDLNFPNVITNIMQLE